VDLYHQVAHLKSEVICLHITTATRTFDEEQETVNVSMNCTRSYIHHMGYWKLRVVEKQQPSEYTHK
jgi:hypothetical protein